MQLPVQNLLAPALAQLTEDAGRLGGTQGPDLTRYFLVCAVLIGATAGVTWGLKRLLAANLRTRAAQRSLQVLDVLGLGGKRQVAVVRCYDRTFLLGLGEREVNSIAELDPVVGAERPAPAPAPADQAAFSQALERLRGVLPGQPAGAPQAAPTLPQDTVDPRLHAELERRYAEAARRLDGERAAAGSEPSADVVVEPVAAAQTEASPRPRLVRRKVVRRRDAADGERARSVASAALEMAESMKRERAARPAQPAAAAEAARESRSNSGETPAPAEPPRPRLEGVLG